MPLTKFVVAASPVTKTQCVRNSEVVYTVRWASDDALDAFLDEELAYRWAAGFVYGRRDEIDTCARICGCGWDWQRHEPKESLGITGFRLKCAASLRFECGSRAIERMLEAYPREQYREVVHAWNGYWDQYYEECGLDLSDGDMRIVVLPAPLRRT